MKAHMREPLPYWATHKRLQEAMQSLGIACLVIGIAAFFGAGFALF